MHKMPVHYEQNDPDFAQLCEVIMAEMRRLQVPGVAVGLLYEGREHLAGFGVTSVENPLPVSAGGLARRTIRFQDATLTNCALLPLFDGRGVTARVIVLSADTRECRVFDWWPGLVHVPLLGAARVDALWATPQRMASGGRFWFYDRRGVAESCTTSLRGDLNLGAVRVLVLDEADEMLSMGFAKELNAILEMLPEDRQTFLFSATVDGPVERMAQRHLKSPERIALSGDAVGALGVSHFIYLVTGLARERDLVRVIEVENPENAIIFCNRKRDVDILVKERESVDAFALALAPFTCLVAPAWIPHGRQYYAEYEVDGVRVGISTVEWETDADGIECLGRGPWEHYVCASCGPYAVPAVALELRLVSELSRDRPDRYIPLIQHLRENGCDLDLVRRGMEARDLSQAVREDVLDQLEAASGRSS